MSRAAMWHRRARSALESYFERHSFPRTMVTLILIITAVCGFLISYALLRLGVGHMWMRYPIAALVAYGILLGLVRLWVEVECRRFKPEEAGLDRTMQHGQAANDAPGRWLDCLDVPDVGGIDFDEGCLPVILVGVVVGLAILAVITIAGAPLLIAEVFLDVFLVAALYRRLQVAEREHWLGTAIRRTWSAALLTILLLALGGWVLEQMAPGTRSIGPAIEQIRSISW